MCAASRSVFACYASFHFFVLHDGHIFTSSSFLPHLSIHECPHLRHLIDVAGSFHRSDWQRGHFLGLLLRILHTWPQRMQVLRSALGRSHSEERQPGHFSGGVSRRCIQPWPHWLQRRALSVIPCILGVPHEGHFSSMLSDTHLHPQNLHSAPLLTAASHLEVWQRGHLLGRPPFRDTHRWPQRRQCSGYTSFDGCSERSAVLIGYHFHPAIRGAVIFWLARRRPFLFPQAENISADISFDIQSCQKNTSNIATISRYGVYGSVL